MSHRPGRGPAWGAGNTGSKLLNPPGSRRFSAVSGLSAGRIATILALVAITACSGGPEPPPEAPPYTDPGFVEAGGYRLYYALTLTGDLPSGIADSYGIVQRPNLALLAITIQPIGTRAVSAVNVAEVEATLVSLTGMRQEVTLRRHLEAGLPTWLATVGVHHRLPFTIEIRARATPSSPELRVRLTREFRVE